MKHTTLSFCVIPGLSSVLVGMLSPSALAVSGDMEISPAARVILGQPEDQSREQSGDQSDPLDTPDSWLLGWTGSVELGMNGASGNNDRFNLRAGFDAERESEKYFDKLSFSYTYAQDEAVDTQNRFYAEVRHDWKFSGENPWRVFITGTYEYDEFQDWNQRITIGPGVGYQAIKNDKSDLLLRVGIVGTKEFGGSDNAWTPEADLGFDFEHKLTQRQTLKVKYDVYPSLKKVGEFRMTSNVGWQIDIDPEVNMYLKLGIEDRYDSTPGPGKNRNDLNYYATIGFSF